MTAEIRRVFAYHGAEHKAISAHEARRPLTPDEVDRFSTAHTRCGTTFLLIVVVISIFFFGLIPRAGVPLPLLFLSRIVLVPVIAGVAYELVRFGASHYGSRLVRALYAPGLWLQALTTRPPDHSMLEVSIASLESCLASDRAASAPASPNR
jgi:Predicted metal-dependent enzyme